MHDDLLRRIDAALTMRAPHANYLRALLAEAREAVGLLARLEEAARAKEDAAAAERVTAELGR